MDAGVTSFRSILDKPLSQLTEDDISQLTREDCRKYLKEKGMRRPSWNKSQAIQQVISLKALLETSEDSGAGALRRILVSKPPPVVKELSVDASNKNAVSVEENAQTDSHSSVPLQHDNTDMRSPCAGDASAGQMTVFYSGKVNVYDGVPPNKTQSEKHGVAPPGATDFQIMHSEKMKESPRNSRETINAAHDPVPGSMYVHDEQVISATRGFEYFSPARTLSAMAIVCVD